MYLLYASGASGVLVEVDEGLFKALLARESVPWERAVKVAAEGDAQNGGGAPGPPLGVPRSETAGRPAGRLLRS